MDMATLVAELVKALAWPLTCTLLALCFRRQLIGLFDGLRLRRLKGKDFEIEFEETMKATKAIQPPGANSRVAIQKFALADMDDDLIVHAPQGAILAAWAKLEGTLVAASEQAGIKDGPSTNIGRILDGLAEKGALQPSTIQVITSLRHLRNLVAHSSDNAQDRITPGNAREFVTMANAAAWSVQVDVKAFLAKGAE